MSPGTPQNFYCQTANGQNLVSWDQSTGSTSYVVQRSLDGVTYSTLATISGTPLASLYLDTDVVLGTQYWYQTAAVNGSGSSNYTLPQSVVPVTTGEMCLSQIRLASQQKSDRVNSNFVGLPEWNQYINRAMFELYDLLITVYEDLYIAPPAQFVTNGNQFQYPLPDGVLTFVSGTNVNVTYVAPPFYKLRGVDLAIQNTNNGYVTLSKFNFIDRNQFVYPNSASTIYGVFNMRYRLMGNNLEFIPTPSANQAIRLWYIPRLNQLLKDTDVTTTGISGWIEYVITRAAKYALDKEESPTDKLDAELLFLKARIEESASNRDAGSPDTISDTRTTSGNWGYGMGGGWNGSTGGF